MSTLPITQQRESTEDSVYSNLDHALNQEIVKELESGDKFALHAAWNFCGYVYKDETGWHEELWQYGSPVAILSGESAEDVIRQANEEYGND